MYLWRNVQVFTAYYSFIQQCELMPWLRLPVITSSILAAICILCSESVFGSTGHKTVKVKKSRVSVWVVWHCPLEYTSLNPGHAHTHSPHEHTWHIHFCSLIFIPNTTHEPYLTISFCVFLQGWRTWASFLSSLLGCWKPAPRMA